MKKMKTLFIIAAVSFTSMPALAHAGYSTTQIQVNHQVITPSGRYVSVQYSTAKAYRPHAHPKRYYQAHKPNPPMKHHGHHSHRHPHRPHY